MARGIERHRDRLVEEGYLATTQNEELWRVTARVPAIHSLTCGDFVEQVRRQVNPIIDEWRSARDEPKMPQPHQPPQFDHWLVVLIDPQIVDGLPGHLGGIARNVHKATADALDSLREKEVIARLVQGDNDPDTLVAVSARSKCSS